MAKMSWVRIRGFIAGVFALILVIVLAALGTAVMGIEAILKKELTIRSLQEYHCKP